jgi:hypothetical protein
MVETNMIINPANIGMLYPTLEYKKFKDIISLSNIYFFTISPIG